MPRHVNAEEFDGNKGVGWLAPLSSINKEGLRTGRKAGTEPTLRSSLRRGLEGGRRLECG
jgi:hypothetical protein